MYIILCNFRLIENHEEFEKALRGKQGLVDEATRSQRKLLDLEENVKKNNDKALKRYYS